MTQLIYKNEVDIKELREKRFLKKFDWEEKIVSITEFINKLEEANAIYAIETNTQAKCQCVWIEEGDLEEVKMRKII
jgi:hypothetical protein